MNVKSLINLAERKFVEGILKDLENDLKKHSEFDDELNRDLDYVRIKAQIYLCKKLLGHNK